MPVVDSSESEHTRGLLAAVVETVSNQKLGRSRGTVAHAAVYVLCASCNLRDPNPGLVTVVKRQCSQPADVAGPTVKPQRASERAALAPSRSDPSHSELQ